MSVPEAIKVLEQAGAVFVLPEPPSGLLRLEKVAARLDVSESWVRKHLDLFPNRLRLPAASSGDRNVGEWRIPVRDVVAFEGSRRLAG